MRCVIKIANRRDVDGHNEALCLLRNMCGHTRFRRLLIERHNISAVIHNIKKKSIQDIKKLSSINSPLVSEVISSAPIFIKSFLKSSVDI